MPVFSGTLSFPQTDTLPELQFGIWRGCSDTPSCACWMSPARRPVIRRLAERSPFGRTTINR